MDVRCPGCGAAVSEWAARCPHCATGLDGAVAWTPTTSPPTSRRSRRPVMFGAAVIAVIAVVAVVGVAVSRSGRSGPHAPPALTGRIPPSLAREVLFVDDGGVPQLVHADGQLMDRFVGARASAYPDEPVGGTGGAAAFMGAGHHAYVVTIGSRRVLDLGAATGVFPAPGDAIGVQSAPEGKKTAIRDVVVGRSAGTVMTRFVLPVGSQAIGQLPTALVATRRSDVQVLTAPGQLGLGRVDVVGAGGHVVAWDRTCAPSTRLAIRGVEALGCGLHLTDVEGGPPVTVIAPKSTEGFASGGAVSPDGSVVAAFVHPDGFTTHLRLALVDVQTGRVHVVGPTLTVGEPIGAAAWSLDGRWVYFCGLGGSIDAQGVAGDGPVGLPVALPLTATYSLAGV